MQSFESDSADIERAALTRDFDNDKQPHPIAPAATDPKQWPEKKKWAHILVLASIALATPLASAIYTPALEQIETEFHASRTLTSLSVPAYVLGFATGPLVIAPLSKMLGRLHIYNASNMLLLLGNVGCALAPTIGWLVVFRFMAGCAGACVITQGSGTIADIIEKEKRGKAVALVSFGSLLGPMLGPALGGRIAEKLSWRGCFWMLVGVNIFNTAITLLFMRETSVSHVNRAEAWGGYELLTAEEEAGGHKPRRKPFLQLFFSAAVSPFSLVFHPVFAAVAIVSAFFYGLQVMLYIDVPLTYKAEYGFTTTQAGLAFLGLGAGMLCGLLTFGIFSDWIIVKLASNGTRKPEHRLPLVISSACLVAGGLLAYAATARPQVPWAVPLCANGVVSAGLFSISMSLSTYLIDMSPERAVDSAAMLAIVRFPTGAVMPVIAENIASLVGRTMMKNIFAGVALSSISVIFLLYQRGEKIRATRPF